LELALCLTFSGLQHCFKTFGSLILANTCRLSKAAEMKIDVVLGKTSTELARQDMQLKSAEMKRELKGCMIHDAL
jgi:hypothetical protein